MVEPSSTAPRPRQRRTFEYFLYAAVIVETALAAGFYKIIFRSPELGRLSIYFGIVYFAFLAWAIAQLNMLHRDRRLQPIAEEKALVERDLAREAGPTTTALGLTASQLVIVVMVFATAVAAFSWALRALR